MSVVKEFVCFCKRPRVRGKHFSECKAKALLLTKTVVSKKAGRDRKDLTQCKGRTLTLMWFVRHCVRARVSKNRGSKLFKGSRRLTSWSSPLNAMLVQTVFFCAPSSGVESNLWEFVTKKCQRGDMISDTNAGSVTRTSNSSNLIFRFASGETWAKRSTVTQRGSVSYQSNCLRTGLSFQVVEMYPK